MCRGDSASSLHVVSVSQPCDRESITDEITLNFPMVKPGSREFLVWIAICPAIVYLAPGCVTTHFGDQLVFLPNAE